MVFPMSYIRFNLQFAAFPGHMGFSAQAQSMFCRALDDDFGPSRWDFGGLFLAPKWELRFFDDEFMIYI
jgi:hypothetical protein